MRDAAKARYVEVPAEAIFTFLESKGFARCKEPSREVVYQREHHRDATYMIKVYTSVAAGNAKARGNGADAIRVVAVRYPKEHPWRAYGVAKLPRVYRTGSVEKVFARTLERMRDAYAVCGRKIAASCIRPEARHG